MLPTFRPVAVPVLSLLVALTCMDAGLVGQARQRDGEWTTYGGDLASRRYRPFDQINRDNFKDLEVAWRF
jgi:glucose dehydrogenase